MRLTRRRFLLAAAGLTIAGGASAVYARRFEPWRLEITQRTVPLGIGAAGTPIRLLHLSDLHASREIPLGYIAHAIAAGLALRPDIVCLTGDFITRRHEILTGYADVLRKLSDATPTFATLGNHDGGAWAAEFGGEPTNQGIRDVLAAARIPCLHNQLAELTIRGRALQLVGLGDYWNGECRPEVAFAALEGKARVARVVLSHNPDSKALLLTRDWDLLLSGHTHGGQIGLPFLARHFAPVLDKRFLSGLHRWENRWIHVSKGVGCLHGVRFNCRPEVSLLTLV